jgi:hypothetical protein
MFIGQVTWTTGIAAAEVLEDYLKTDAGDAGLPKMPSSVAKVLRKCFRHSIRDTTISTTKIENVLESLQWDSSV